MKIRFAIAFVLLSFALPSLGAKSPLTHKDYIFTHPALTNRITGTVLGDDGQYGYIRYEDFAFLAEACAERSALASDSISTNEFLNSATNGAPAVAVSNAFNSAVIPTSEVEISIAGSYLSPDCIESDVPRVIIPAGNPLYAVTSVVSRCRSSTNLYHIATNLITQVMTNGTLDVHTNAYAGWSFRSNVLDRVVVVTNVLSADDFCTTGRVITVAENIPESWNLDSIGHEPRMRDVVTNAFGFVRQMRRTVPKAFDFEVAASNATFLIDLRGHGGPDDKYSEKATSYKYHVEVNRVAGMSDLETRYDEDSEWRREDGYPKNEDYSYVRATTPDTLPLTISNNLSQIVLTYGMPEGSRINKAQAFAHVTLDYTTHYSAYHTTSDDLVYDTQPTNETDHGEVMIPLGTTYRSEGETLTFTVDVDPNIYKTAAALCGLPAIDTLYVPTVPSVQSPEWYETATRREKSSTSSRNEQLDGDISVYLILYVNPKTILLDWTEYE